MAHEFSKENQSSAESAYRFSDFALFPQDRLLKRTSASIPLQPKAFDALHLLVRNADHLVTKLELTRALWPDVHVSEANLTNLIVGLRKILGRDAIRTVSRHGYRFELPVSAEPGVKRETYEKFVRAKELTVQRSVGSMEIARELCWICLAEDPGFAPAWAWLGRCCWFLDKFTSAKSAGSELAEAAFRRAFVLDPDSAHAHQFYTNLQLDMGHADQAMSRLLERLELHPDEPETYSGLVQVFRFRGLLSESVEAHKRAVELDPVVTTSVAHTFFLAGKYETAIEIYGGRGAYYLDAAAWAGLGEKKRAIALLRDRLKKAQYSELIIALMTSLLALLEGKTAEAARIMNHADAAREPEILVYFARHYSQMRLLDASLAALQKASSSGFTCAPETLKSDPWLKPLQKHRAFRSLLKAMQSQVAAARITYESIEAGSNRHS